MNNSNEDVPGRESSSLRPIRTAVTGPGNLLDNLRLEPLGGRASCAETPWDDMTFDEKKTLCQRCPVVDACLEEALKNHEKFDVWGGLAPEEREKVHRSRLYKTRRAARERQETPA